MCIGVPMKIIEVSEFYALCEGMGETKQIDLSLVGVQAVGTWVLTFLGAAREILTDESAAQITNALAALDIAMQGESDGIDALFDDLINREPELPEHLK